jgi:exonuclease III
MKICTYNLRSGGHKNLGNHWQLLLKDLEADIVCAQESEDPSRYFIPETFSGFKSCIHANVAHGKWGSAILAKDHVLTRIEIPGFNGWVTGARIRDVKIDGIPKTLTVFCIHAPSPGSYESHVNRFLDEIGPYRDDTPLLIAGDFNLTTAVRHNSEDGMKNTPGERRIHERLRREFGLLNAWQVLHPNQNLPQTLRWTNAPSKPYHCDGIFISHSLVPYLVRAEVIEDGEFASLSDHNPILIELA